MLLQDGPVTPHIAEGARDAQRNADNIKAALYFLGADAVGISRCPDWAYYSHDALGDPLVTSAPERDGPATRLAPGNRGGDESVAQQAEEHQHCAIGDESIAGGEEILRIGAGRGSVEEELILILGRFIRVGNGAEEFGPSGPCLGYLAGSIQGEAGKTQDEDDGADRREAEKDPLDESCGFHGVRICRRMS